MSNKIAGQISNAVQNGILPLPQALNEIKSIPSDPAGQATWIQNHLINSLSGEAKIQAMMPQAVTADTGQGTAFFNRNPLTGAMTPNGFVARGMTQADLAAPKTITMPDGSQRQVTTQEWLQMQGGTGGAPGGYTGRNDGSGAGGASSGPGTLAALGPGQQAALTAQAGTSNTAAQTLHDAAADAPMRINLLNTARDALSNITTGPGTDWRNTMASALNSTPALGDALKSMGVTDPNKIASYDEFKKILTNYASSVSGSLGTGTDARLNAAVTGNANPGISNMANGDILTKTLAAEKMRAAQDYAFQNSGLTTDKFNQWQSQWNRNVNPDAFAYSAMTPEQRAAYKARVPASQFERLRQDYNALAKQGLFGGGQ